MNVKAGDTVTPVLSVGSDACLFLKIIARMQSDPYIKKTGRSCEVKSMDMVKTKPNRALSILRSQLE